jgi:L,D-peptidoglycan transpeptidase YkuD (ErfK/YbiS/YcfS/YnhG family)
MKQYLQRLLALALAMVLALSTVPKIPAQAASDTVPGKVALVSIESPGYHKITINWKGTTGASQYHIYYRREGETKWTKIAKVSGSARSYTHVYSSKFPIVIGRNYTYTVRAYNSTSRRYGEYDHKGLTAQNIPDKVTLQSAVWNAGKKAVTLKWNKTAGGDYYRIYRKSTSSPKWKTIAYVSSDKLSYVDKTASATEKNVYTVRVYHSKMKVLGQVNSAGITAREYQDAATQAVANALARTATAKKTKQIILVVDHNLSFWEKDAQGYWNRKLSAYCGYGSNGMSTDRHEGDRTTPVGSFPILHGFGIAANPGSAMQYRKVTNNSYWSGEYSTYNQWVESTRPVAGEHLISYYQYKYAMAIGFNRNPTVYKKGSDIFLHCKSYDHWSTAGCVSVEESVMKRLLVMSRNGVYMIIVRNQNEIDNY